MLLLGQGVATLILGLILFLIPMAAATFWPWNISPLSSQAIGAGWLAIAVGSLQAYRESDLLRLRPGLVAFLAIITLELLAVALHATDIKWNMVSAWVYLGYLIGALLFSAITIIQQWPRLQMTS